MSTPEPITLIHIPFGDEHPYRATPFERTPREPIAGQPIQLGLGTRPAGAVQAVQVRWRVDDGPEQVVPATAQEDVEGATRWLASLPAGAAGDRVSYRFETLPDGSTSSEEAFTVAGWERAGRVADWRASGTAVTVRLEAGPTVTVSADAEGVLSISAGFGAQSGPSGGLLPLTVAETAGRLAIAVGDWRCAIQLDPYRLDVRTATGATLWADPREGGLTWLTDGERVRRVALTRLTPPDEAFYGFGERFNALDQRGEAIDSIVYEEYKNQGRRTYLPVPFFVSSLGYGAHLVTSRRAYFDLAADAPDRATVAVEDDTLRLELTAGSPKEVVPAFVKRVGKAVLPPKWAFGLWMSSNEWNSQAAVAEQVALTEYHGIPASVLVIEAWSDESTFYIFNDARYTPRPGAEGFHLQDFVFPPDGLWPDPKGMVDDLHRRGIRLVLWQIPVLKQLDAPHAQQDADRQHATEAALVVREADGEQPYRVRPFWFHDAYVPDFTSPAARAWWQAKRRYLVDELGVDGFKTDGGEHLWGNGLRYSDGRTGAEANNLFPNLYAGVYSELGGAGRLNFSRAGYTGAQTVSTHWAGDENSTFEAFRHSITAGLTAGLSGVSFWGWDIGGFSGPIPSAELYLRATAMATFCPIMQYHSEFNQHREPRVDRTPWNIQERTGDPDVLPIFRFYANLRLNLFPYIWSEAIKSSRSGLPMMRALPLEFPSDEQARAYPFQYLFGEALLIAPVAWEGRTEQAVYLPEGLWYDFWTGERFEGRQVVTVATPKHRIPVFARGGTVIGLHLGSEDVLGQPVATDLDTLAATTFRTFAGHEPATFLWYDDPQGEPRRFDVVP
ncbi:MAG TPA: glycoside hydrolase family 31 protein [Anaerolineales bacterium]|nr:glycoside hydrolase family 31 protein [Anaerolineales bacterium]